MSEYTEPARPEQPTTGTASEGTLSRIRGLLAKAENTPYEQEAETYRAAAFALIAKHSIDEALVAGPRPEADEMGETTIELDGSYGDARAALVGAIARAMHCYTLNWRDRRGVAPSRVTVYGRRSDREKVELLYTSLLLQATRQLAAVQPEGYGRTSAGRTRAARRSWLYGFAYTVEDRLTEKFEEAVAGTGTELVLADRRDAAQQYAKSLHKIGKPRTARLSDAAAMQAGAAAGRRADLGTERLGGRAARQLTG